MTYKPCAIIPCYNHPLAIEQLVQSLVQRGLSVIVIDDGSTEPAKTIVENLHCPDKKIISHRLVKNQGKGAAVIEGLKMAQKYGYSHAIQIDADGQHDLENLDDMLSLAEKNPTSLISGNPVYDQSIPLGRKIGRWITHFWVWIETLSFQIRDSMCGFRVYPLQPTLALLNNNTVGQRMDFDTEIMVRLFWRNVPVIMTPVRVTYPIENTSNFETFWDNWRISKMHTRLFFGMLLRFPLLIGQKLFPNKKSNHWASLNERGALWGIYLLGAVYHVLGVRVCFLLAQPVLLYFFLTNAERRNASVKYLRKVEQRLGERESINLWRAFKHYQSFARMALDKLAAWNEGISVDQLIFPEQGDLERLLVDQQGIVILASHLGNIEVSRALSQLRHDVKITVFAHTKHAAKFNQLLTKYNPKAAIDVVEVSDLGPATAVDLQERLARGEWVVIAGDRTPVEGTHRVSSIPFLGEDALFPQGGIILASLLKTPVYLMLCMKEGNKFRLIFDKLSDRVALPRGSRREAIDIYLKKYAEFLEAYCMKYPDQWYNFFDFWKKDN